MKNKYIVKIIHFHFIVQKQIERRAFEIWSPTKFLKMKMRHEAHEALQDRDNKREST